MSARQRTLPSPSASPRRRRAEDRRTQLIDTALPVFARKGFDGASVKDLAEAAGVGQGLLYHYFATKEALLAAVIERHSFVPELRQLVDVVADRPVAEGLLEVALRFTSVLAAHDQSVRIFYREAQTSAAVGAQVRPTVQEAVALLARYLQARIDAGELRAHDTRVAACCLLFTIFTAHLTGVGSDQFLSGVVDMLCHGLVATSVHLTGGAIS